MKAALLFLAFAVAASAQDPALPKDPPASTLNSNPPTLYSQWVTVAKYYYAKAQQAAPSATFSGIDVIKVTIISKSDLTLAWDYVNQGQTGFTVERSTDGTTFTTLATLADPVARAYTDKGLAAGSYWYRVRAYKPAEISAPSNVATGAIP